MVTGELSAISALIIALLLLNLALTAAFLKVASGIRSLLGGVLGGKMASPLGSGEKPPSFKTMLDWAGALFIQSVAPKVIEAAAPIVVNRAVSALGKSGGGDRSGPPEGG